MIAWSLGVLDTLASVHVAGDRRLAGLVLVDNSVGEDPPPAAAVPRARRAAGRRPTRMVMRPFVRAMFHRPQPAAYLEPPDRGDPAHAGIRQQAAAAPIRSRGRTGVRRSMRPRCRCFMWFGRAGLRRGRTLVRNRPDTEMEVFDDAGHALFVDEPARFNARDGAVFCAFRVWP